MKEVAGGSTFKLASPLHLRDNAGSIAYLELGGSRRPGLAHRISAMHDGSSGNATSDKRWS